MNLRPLRVLQLNVARANWRMSAVLNSLTDYDIILFQEPWFSRVGIARSSTDPSGIEILGTVSNHAWESFVPTTVNERRPRVASFVRKGINHLYVHSCPDVLDSPDIIMLSFHYGNISFDIINIYNAGPGRNANSVRALMDAELDPLTPTIISGDFNLHHPLWALENGQQHAASGTADELVEWLESHAFSIENDLVRATRRGQTADQHDSIIDLTLLNHAAADIDLIGEWECSEEQALTLTTTGFLGLSATVKILMWKRKKQHLSVVLILL
jgi:hypothetical protein